MRTSFKYVNVQGGVDSDISELDLTNTPYEVVARTAYPPTTFLTFTFVYMKFTGG